MPANSRWDLIQRLKGQKAYCSQAEVAELKTRNEVQKIKHKKLAKEGVKNFPSSIGFIIKINNIELFNWKTMSFYGSCIKSGPLARFA